MVRREREADGSDSRPAAEVEGVGGGVLRCGSSVCGDERTFCVRFAELEQYGILTLHVNHCASAGAKVSTECHYAIQVA
jgi:hypothetical protein